jgi:hypothetical protein
MVSVEVVAPEYEEEFVRFEYVAPLFVLTCHLYVIFVPLTPIENAVLLPLQTEMFEGCEVIDGAVLTVRVAAFDVAGGVQDPLTTQRY